MMKNALMIPVMLFTAFASLSYAADAPQWSLTDQNGKTITETDFRGRMMLVLVKKTDKSGACPTGLSTLSKTLEMLDAEAPQVAAIFIDTNVGSSQLKSCLAKSNAAITGLTGTAKDIEAAASIYKAHSNAEPKDFIYMIDRKGKFVGRFPQNASVDVITEKLWPAMSASL